MVRQDYPADKERIIEDDSNLPGMCEQMSGRGEKQAWYACYEKGRVKKDGI